MSFQGNSWDFPDWDAAQQTFPQNSQWGGDPATGDQVEGQGDDAWYAGDHASHGAQVWGEPRTEVPWEYQATEGSTSLSPNAAAEAGPSTGLARHFVSRGAPSHSMTTHQQSRRPTDNTFSRLAASNSLPQGLQGPSAAGFSSQRPNIVDQRWDTMTGHATPTASGSSQNFTAPAQSFYFDGHFPQHHFSHSPSLPPYSPNPGTSHFSYQDLGTFASPQHQVLPMQLPEYPSSQHQGTADQVQRGKIFFQENFQTGTDLQANTSHYYQLPNTWGGAEGHIASPSYSSPSRPPVGVVDPMSSLDASHLPGLSNGPVISHTMVASEGSSSPSSPKEGPMTIKIEEGPGSGPGSSTDYPPDYRFTVSQMCGNCTSKEERPNGCYGRVSEDGTMGACASCRNSRLTNCQVSGVNHRKWLAMWRAKKQQRKELTTTFSRTGTRMCPSCQGDPHIKRCRGVAFAGTEKTCGKCITKRKIGLPTICFPDK